MNITMSKKQLFALFFCNLAPTTIGFGLAPLIPVHATRNLGVAPAVTGYLLAFIFLAQAIGTTTAGVLSDKFQKRKVLIIVAGLGNPPILWLMGKVTVISHFFILIGVSWFLTGIGVVLLNILTGLFADPAERGKVFGILALTEGLGATFGGLTTGQIADRAGFPTLFAILALFSILLPISALFLKDKVVHRDESRSMSMESNTRARPKLEKPLQLLLIANLISGIAMFMGSLGRSLTMTGLGFSAAAISSTVAVGGMVTLPLRPLFGELSDRYRRENILILFYTTSAIALSILAIAVTLTEFWIAFAILYIGTIRGAIGAALVTDLTTRETLGIGMSVFSATNWVGGIIGYAITGNAVQYIGRTNAMFIAATLPLISIPFLLQIRKVR